MQTNWIALFLHDRVNNYQLLLRDDAEKAARRYSHKLVVHSADKNAETQVRQIRSLLVDSRGNPPRAILVSPVIESSLIGVMAEAASQRIPWAYLCRWSETVHALRRDHPGYSVFSVAADQAQIGRLQGQILSRQITEEHELIYIQGPQGTSSVSRREAALRRELECFPALRWARYNADWSTDGGAAAMRSWLDTFKRGKLPPFSICAQNDDMAWGARMALTEGGFLSRGDKPVIIGCDGLTTFGQRLVAEGVLTATVVVPPVSGRAIDELFRALSMNVVVPAEVSIDVLAHPSLDQLTNRASFCDKLSHGSHGAISNRRMLVTSAAPPSSTRREPSLTVPPSGTSSLSMQVSRKTSKPEEDPSADAQQRLFMATLKQVADSSRQAAAARSRSTEPGTSSQRGPTDTSASGRGRTDPRGRT